MSKDDELTKEEASPKRTHDPKRETSKETSNKKLLYSVDDVIQITGISRSKINQMIKDEILESLKIGRRRFFKASYIDGLFA